MIVTLGAAPNYAAQYPKLWKFRPALTLDRDKFSAALAAATSAAADEAETFTGDEPQPKGPDGEPLFMPASSWFIASTSERKRIWRTWLADEWLIDFEGAQPGRAASGKTRQEVAKDVRQASAKRLEDGTKAMQTPLLPWWAWAAIAAGGALVVYRMTR